MVALWTACLVMPALQVPAHIEAYPDEILDVISQAGIDVEGTRAAWLGRLTSNGLTVNYKLESRSGRAVALDLTSRYSFPVRVSSRALQDWAIGTHTGIFAQSNLDGSVYLAERLPIVEPVTKQDLFVTVQNGLTAFRLFDTYYVKPLRGEQVMDQPTIFPPKPSDGMVVDYLSSQDFLYLAKLWGWAYDGPFGAAISPTWTVPVSVHRRLWRISGPVTAPTENTSYATFTVAGQFQARSNRAQDQFRRWAKRFKRDKVVFSPDSADVELSTTIDLKGGLSLATIRKRILDFVRRTEKLPPEDNSVFG
jgi:hypothetical protein